MIDGLHVGQGRTATDRGVLFNSAAVKCCDYMASELHKWNMSMEHMGQPQKMKK